MKLTITTELKRKTHSPSGERGKTLCGKRQGPTVPTTTDRPTCMVCTVVYDQAARGIVREMNKKSEADSKTAKEKDFAHGFAFGLVQFMRNNGRSADRDVLQVFKDAGYGINDFAHAQWDETDRQTLVQIFRVEERNVI